MPTFVTPQSTAFAAFRQVPNVAARPLRAHISGPHAFLVRYAEDDEQVLGHLGIYDNAIDTEYAWPNQPDDSVLDLAYTKLWVKNALLRYFSIGASGGASITKIAGYSNRIHSATLSFKSNGASFPRSADFLDRDVAVGDVVKVRAIDENLDAITLWTTVRDIVGDISAASVGASEDDADNATAQGVSTAITQVAGAENCVTLAASAAAYDDLAGGHIIETYDLLVLAGSVNGDYTTATIRVISGSGTDDVDEVTPSAASLPTDIGTRGLTVTFDEADTAACSDSAAADSVSADDLITGQRWRVVVHQDFTPPVATSGGTYDGDEDNTYIVTVSRGGLFGSSDEDMQPQITVTTVDGTDLSGPTNIADAGDDAAVGTHGVTISFTGDGLRKGDRYSIPVTGTTTGAMSTLVLANNLASTIADGTLVDLDLYIKNPLLEVPMNRVGFAPTTNWTATADNFTVASGITAYDSTWTDSGTQLPLAVFGNEDQEYGDMFVEYRAWLSDLSKRLLGVSASGTDAELLAALDPLIPGAVHPDNPLKQAVFLAMKNANGSEIKFTGVTNPDVLADWADAVGMVVGRDDVYGLVPLTKNTDVLELYKAHVLAMSEDDVGLWRHLWYGLTAIPLLPLVSGGSDVPGHTAATTTDGDVCLCTIQDDPNTSGTQYTLVNCPAGNANFITNGVRAGDTLRAQYVSDGFGNYSYTEYTIDSVVSEDELLLVTGTDVAVNTASKVEVWRTLTAAEESAAIVAQARTISGSRIEPVWPDTVEASGVTLQSYHLCAALAGLSSAILPHQSLLRLEIVGIDDASRSYQKFIPEHLDVLKTGGVWVVSQDPVSLVVFTRDAFTSAEDQTDLLTADEMCVRNLDSIQYRFKESFDKYIGVTNAVAVVLQRISVEAEVVISQLRSEASTNSNLGAQLISGTVDNVSRHAVFQNHFVVALSLTIPVTTERITTSITVVIG